MKRLSAAVILISPAQCTNWSSAKTAKAIPVHGWSQRQTCSPPKSGASHPKMGVQMGSPVKRQRKKVSATPQCTTRV